MSRAICHFFDNMLVLTTVVVGRKNRMCSKIVYVVTTCIDILFFLQVGDLDFLVTLESSIP